jgi:hypothetical protein
MIDDTARMGETENMIRDMNQYWTAGWHACRAGWRSFTQAVVIHEWRETDYIVQIYTGGKSAVVTYVISITFAGGRGRQTMQGRDMVFLVKEGRRLLVAADQFSPEPPQTASAGS